SHLGSSNPYANLYSFDPHTVQRGIIANMNGLKYTKIIATLGPASSSLDQMRQLIRAGADCLRINFSHADGEAVQPLIDTARRAAAEEKKHITLLADIQGPKLRIGKLPPQGVLLTEG